MSVAFSALLDLVRGITSMMERELDQQERAAAEFRENHPHQEQQPPSGEGVGRRERGWDGRSGPCSAAETRRWISTFVLKPAAASLTCVCEVMVPIPTDALVCDCQGPSRCGRRWLAPAGVVCLLLCLYSWMPGTFTFPTSFHRHSPSSRLCFLIQETSL